MHAVIFEVMPKAGNTEAYLDMAANLLPELEQIEGFVSIERFQSLSAPEKLLSLSFWETEEAVIAWRQHAGHRLAQQAGRGGIFADYQLRVVTVIRDYGMFERLEAPDNG